MLSIRRLTILLVMMTTIVCGRMELVSAAAVQTSPLTFSEIPDSSIFDITWNDRSVFRDGLIQGEEAALLESPGASVYHIDLALSDDLTHLDGREEVCYTNQETVPLHNVYFHLFPNLLGGRTEIASVEVDAAQVAPELTSARSAMRVPLAQALLPGERVVISISFSVTVPTGGDNNYGIFALTDGILALAHFYPLVAVYDDKGWNTDIPPSYGDILYADTSFFIVCIKAPHALTIVASGIEINRETVDNAQRVTYAAGPMRDFYLAACARYTAVSTQVGETTINSYAPPDSTVGAMNVLEYAASALRVFNNSFGAYPFKQFDLVSTPTLAFGVEYPGVVALNIDMYGRGNSTYPPYYLEPTVAHEVAHQWFYSVVGNDQLGEPWLDEALAQYATLIYMQTLYGTAGAAGFRNSLQERWARVSYADIPIGLKVRDYTATEYGAIVYGRAPLFLCALAETMGRQTFDDFLRDYYREYQWRIATTDGFEQLAEIHCNCDLTPLFSDWVYSR